METTFDDWLLALKRSGKGPIQLDAATRGLAWSQPFTLAGDWHTAAVEGGVTDSPGNAEIASFTISALTYDSVTGKTSWTASLASTSGLPADDDLDGVTYLPFALRLTPSGGAKDVMVGGVFTLMEPA